jgi:hypothetical protein
MENMNRRKNKSRQHALSLPRVVNISLEKIQKELEEEK